MNTLATFDWLVIAAILLRFLWSHGWSPDAKKTPTNRHPEISSRAATWADLSSKAGRRQASTKAWPNDSSHLYGAGYIPIYYLV